MEYFTYQFVLSTSSLVYYSRVADVFSSLFAFLFVI